MRIRDWTSDVCSSDLVAGTLTRKQNSRAHRLVSCTETFDRIALRKSQPAMDLRLLPVRAHRADAQCIHTRVRRERLAQGARQKRQRCLTDSVSNGRRNGSEATTALDRRSDENKSELQSLMRMSY